MNLSDIAEYKIYVDLDGVVSDLDNFVLQHTGRTFHEMRGPKFTHFLYRFRQMYGTFFDRLEKLPDADLLWGYLKPYRPSILSATGPLHKEARVEKVMWVRKNLDGAGRIYTVISGKDKYKYAAPNAILIDDTPIAIKNWELAGGIGIPHKNAFQTINRLHALGI